jgi:metallo-beta-lactamase class B
MRVSDGGHIYDAVIIGSPNINPGTKLVNNPLYPRIADDFAAGFRVLHSLPCDLFLGAHGGYFGLLQKVARMTPNGPNVFVDPEGYKAYVTKTQATFEQELAKQQAARR